MNVINPHEISSTMWVGSVASAVLTKKEIFIQEFVLIQIVIRNVRREKCFINNAHTWRKRSR